MEQLVTQWLPEADQDFLVERCTEFQLQIPADKANNPTYMRKMIFRHLTSAAVEQTPDQGKGVWQKICGELGAALGKGAVKSEAPPTPTTTQAPGQGAGTSSSVALGAALGTAALTTSKLREFKINGSVDGGKEGTLQYVSLVSQITLGESANYTTPEIIYGVIRACPPTSAFRTLLESNLSMDMDEFQSLLKSHYGIQDSDSILLQLKSCFQQPSQSAYEFCCRAISLRNQLQRVAAEEGQPWGDDRLKKRLYRTISTGLKQNGVKLDLLPHLTESSTLTDREFLEKVSQAESLEKERLGKVEAKEAEIKLLTQKSALDSSSKSSSSKSSVPAVKSKIPAAPESEKLVAALNALSTNIEALNKNSSDQAKRLGVLEQFLSGQINSLGQANNLNFGNFPVNNNGGGAANQNNLPAANNGTVGNNNASRRYRRCANCVANNVGYCTHCFKCLQSGHRKGDAVCPEN